MNRKDADCMEPDLTQDYEEIHKEFLKCKQIFQPSHELLDIVRNVTDKEEQEFIRTIYTFFLQQKQQEVIKKGIF